VKLGVLAYLSRCLEYFLKDRSFCIKTRYGWPICVRPGKGYTELSMVLFRSFAAEISNLIIDLLPNSGIFIDIGAHIGWFSKLASYKVGSGGCVIAVEPEPTNFRMLEANTRSVPSEIILHNLALGDACYERKLYLGGSSGEHSLKHEFKKFILVEVITGDKLFADLPSADLVKIDVEGAEWEVLRGMAECLKRWSKVKVIVEFLPKHWPFEEVKEFYNFLRSLGFEVYFIERLSLYAKRLPCLYLAPLRKWQSLHFPNILLARDPLPGLPIVKL